MAQDQLKVLNALDVAKTQWYHFTAIVIAGMGFFTDAYDLFSISLVTKLLGRIYYTEPGASKPGSLPPNVSAAVNGVAFCGTLSGQLFFGWLGDKMGRKKVYGMTLMMMVLCSLASGLSFGSEPKGVMATLCFFRFWLGFGIGGDYPLSATIMSEYSNKKTRGAFIAAVFAMQGFGNLTGGIFALIVSAAFKAAFPAPSYATDPTASLVPQADYVWRIILMFGAIPAVMTYYWRMKMPETARYTALVANNAKQAASDMSKVLQVEIQEDQEKAAELVEKNKRQFGLFSKQFMKRHGLHLLGTASCWFLLDIAFYSNNLFQKDIFTAVGNSYKSPPSEQQYSEEVNYAAEMEPSENELSDYISACAKLWELDFNRLNPGKDYELDVGEGKRVHEREDMAEASLFTWVDENVLRKPTFSRFCALLDNYNPYEGCKEKVSEEERREQAAFIEEISRTAPIKYLYKYLSSTGLFTENYQEFKSMLKDLWFTLYGRGGTSGCSSSFEHVFVGEIKSRGEQQVSGFHNWLQFYLEEAKGKADYQGYILPRRNRQFPDAETQLLTVQFEWNGVLKSLSSMFIGVSPEFELALYTLCFFAGGEDNHIEVGPYPVNIKCYRLGNKIGSAFPIAEA